MVRRVDHDNIPVIHQRKPHFNYLPFNELMLASLDNIRDTSIIGALALVNFEVVVVIHLTR
jgi:hypothetical protein